MKMFFTYRWLFCFFLLSVLGLNNSSAQTPTDSIAYTYEFKFNDGIFLNFKQVQSNQAIPTQNIISNLNFKASNFLSEVLKEEKIRLFYNGEKITVNKKQIWGYSSNGVLYINYNDNFFRVPNIGTISMFVATIEQEYLSYQDPWTNPYYMGRHEHTYTSTEIQQFLIDFSNGTVYGLNEKNVSQLISDDSALFKEFSELKRRKRRQLAFSFIKRYNQKHPLYFPKH